MCKMHVFIKEDLSTLLKIQLGAENLKLIAKKHLDIMTSVSTDVKGSTIIDANYIALVTMKVICLCVFGCVYKYLYIYISHVYMYMYIYIYICIYIYIYILYHLHYYHHHHHYYYLYHHHHRYYYQGVCGVCV
jgi:hypothetical protein